MIIQPISFWQQQSGFNLADFGTVIVDHSARFTTGFNDSDPVNAVPDHFGGIAGTETATLLARPTFKANQINGLPALQYDGAANQMVTGVVNHGIGTGDFWLGLIFNYTGAQDFSSPFSIGPTLSFFRSGGGFRFIGCGTDFQGNGVSLNTWMAIELWRSGTTMTITVNGVDMATSTGAGALTDGVPFTEGNGAGVNFYSGMLADKAMVKNQINQAALSTAWRAVFGL